MATKPKKQPRMCYYVPEGAFYREAFNGKGGFRVSIVVEGEAGHRPTGTWPYHGRRGETLPIFWGPSLKEAKEQERAVNERRGLSPKDIWDIITSSMNAQNREERAEQRRAAKRAR